MSAPKSDAIAKGHNTEVAALREQLDDQTAYREAAEFNWKQAVDELVWLRQRDIEQQAALKQKDEALRLISDVVPHFQVAFSMPAGFPVSKQLPPQGYDVWLHDFIAGVIKVQPDSTALKTVFEAKTAKIEVLLDVEAARVLEKAVRQYANSCDVASPVGGRENAIAMDLAEHLAASAQKAGQP